MSRPYCINSCGERIRKMNNDLLCDSCLRKRALDELEEAQRIEEKVQQQLNKRSDIPYQMILSRLNELETENKAIRSHLKEMYHETKYPLPNDDLLKKAEALERENDFLRTKQAESMVENDLQTKLAEARMTKQGVFLDLSEKARNSLKVSEAQRLVEEMQHVNSLPDEEFLQALPKLEKASEALSKVTTVIGDESKPQSRLHLPTKASQARAEEVKKSHSASKGWKR